jgi:hypothetical protein
VRTLLAIAALVGASWGALATLARPGCAQYSDRELRELAALPVPPACVESRLPPVVPGATP